MKILITGTDGLIGSKIYEKLKLFHDVYTEKEYDYNHDDYLFSEPEKRIKLDMIIHCAAHCIIRDVIKDPELMKSNINHTFKIMEITREHKAKVILFSSSRVEHNEENPYITGKRFNENICEAYRNCYGIEYVIIRPETVWGLNDKKVRVIPNWITKALNNEDIIVYGDKNKELPPLYIDSFVMAFMHIVNDFKAYKYKTVKICGETLRVEDIIIAIKFLTKSKSKVKWKKAELTQPQKEVTSDADKICRIGGFYPSLREALQHVL